MASTVTWTEFGELTKVRDPQSKVRIPDGVSPDSPFVEILDPATGTATFLVEVIDVIYRHLKAKWEKGGLKSMPVLPPTSYPRRATSFAEFWNQYVALSLLKRLHGYELMMAPYAIAHMKIGLKLFETGYRFGSDERARIYLTNALKPPQDFSDRFTFDVPALAHEAQAVNSVKRRQRFTIVIGNPPYSVSSWNTNDWITEIAEDYKRTVRLEESQIQSLSNDYIKFLRFGEWQIAQSGVGILGLITGHGYLLGTQPRDLRNHLSDSFELCFCLDLHGSVRRAGTGDVDDEPVFEIMTGVAILIGLRSAIHHGKGTTFLASLTGRLDRKFAFLSDKTALNTGADTQPHRPTAPYFYFARSETAQNIGDEYQRYCDLPTLFGTGIRQNDKEIYWATGFASQQDDLAMSFTRAEVDLKMKALAESQTFDELKQTYRLCTTDQWDYEEAKQFIRQKSWPQRVKQVAYRPFDRRWTVFDKHVLTILRKQVMSQLIGEGHNIALVSSRAINDLRFAHCFVTTEPVDKIFISSKSSTNAYVFPLFFKDDDMYGKKDRPNLSRTFLGSLAQSLDLQITSENGLPEGLTAEDIFHYVYGVLHSPSYRSRYDEFLKIEFPRLPLTSDAELFRKLYELGADLVAVHLIADDYKAASWRQNAYERGMANDDSKNPLAQLITQFRGTGMADIAKGYPKYKDGNVYINGARYFEGVPEEVWNFYVGGYQVCHKWLKDRRGRTLSDEDINHYQRIVVALNETIRLMVEIDRVIEEHGGWPLVGSQDAPNPDAAAGLPFA